MELVNETGSPTHTVALVRGDAVVNSFTESVALFVIEPHAPVTATEYVAASFVVTLLKTSVEFVAPEMTTPFLRHTNVNGPLPPTTVWNCTASPVQFVRLWSGVVVRFVSTTSTAEFVAEPHTPPTSTE